ncbi:unnamed protein product [Calypogeia fissa]
MSGSESVVGVLQRQVYCIGTLDTKDADVQFLAQSLSSALSQFLSPQQNIEVIIVDISTKSPSEGNGRLDCNVGRQDVLSHHPDLSKRSFKAFPKDRGESLSIMSVALTHFLKHCASKGSLGGAIGVGGSGGTSLIAPALRALPLGIPKVLVSTVASANTTPYIGTSDVILFPSVVDVAGLNSISRRILLNAAAAFAGMVANIDGNDGVKEEDGKDKVSVGLTMFGVTTPCVTAIQKQLTDLGFETIVFHATGRGGEAMEGLVGQGLIHGVIDVTTTEVADYLVGGTMACSGTRFEEMMSRQIPLVLSLGALDMVNFGSLDSVPPKFATRDLYVHNEQVTLMRTTVEENRQFAQFIGQQLNKSSAPVRLLVPEKGVSALDAPGMPFHNPEATRALLEEVEQIVTQTTDRQVKRLPYHINDKEFSDALVAAFLDLTRLGSRKIQKENLPQKSLFHDVMTRPMRPNFRHIPFAKSGTQQKYKVALHNLWAQIEQGVPIIGAGAGTGISAKFEEQGGADLIVIYNSGRFRMAGRGSLAGLLPFKDANAVVLEMANEVLPVVNKVPVLAGVCATDPFRQMSTFLCELERIGFQGVQNFPTVGLIDGKFRQNLEETGMGYGLEVDMIRQAHAMGLLTTPYAFNESEASAMAEAGADIVVAHMGLTTAGSIGATTAKSLHQSVELVQAIADAARKVNPEVIVLCHGGPISGPEEAEFVLKRTRGVHGFYGASSMERLPVEQAIKNTMRQYKAIKLTI